MEKHAEPQALDGARFAHGRCAAASASASSSCAAAGSSSASSSSSSSTGAGAASAQATASAQAARAAGAKATRGRSVAVSERGAMHGQQRIVQRAARPVRRLQQPRQQPEGRGECEEHRRGGGRRRRVERRGGAAEPAAAQLGLDGAGAPAQHVEQRGVGGGGAEEAPHHFGRTIAARVDNADEECQGAYLALELPAKVAAAARGK